MERGGALISDLDWLSERPSKARLRVARLIELLKTADLLSRKLGDAGASLLGKRHASESDKLSSTLDRINEILALYRGTRAFWLTDQFDLEEGFVSNRKRLERDDTFEVETGVINFGLELLRRGSIQHLQTCRECKKWFYAMTDHQAYCSSKCRQRFFSRDLNFKERRRKYMKEYRRNEGKRDKRLQQIHGGKK